MAKIPSKLKQVAGTVRETAGKLLNDPVMEAKGHMKTDEGLVEQGTLPAGSKPSNEKPTLAEDLMV
jgi:uncharacterized protein YjbJ (UPF0337 family)